jgi:uncharacterized protein DUF3291
MTGRFHLAQLNIGRMLAPIDDPVMDGFRNQLQAVNAIADRSPGFVWRLQTEDGDATAIRAYEDALMAVNMSVWESLEALHAYVYAGAHVGVLRDRKQWFDPASDHILVLWWVPAGHLPTIDEAKGKLAALREHGPTADAFTFRKAFPPPGAAAIDALEVDAEFCRG